jgi:ribonuclease BN (tRNA processing enzyme)
VHWITLGTAGGPPVHASQSQIANALQVDDAVYLFDVGNGVLRQMDAAKLPVRKIRHVFLTHHHPDHNADLGIVMLSWWLFGTDQPLDVLGPPGTKLLVSGLAAANAPTVQAFFTTGNRPPKPPLGEMVRASDLPADIDGPTVVFEDGIVRVSAISVDHFQVPPSAPMTEMPRAVAYRVEAGGRSFVYSGDTGPSPNLQNLAQGADVLITEVVNIEAIQAYLLRVLKDAPPQAAEELGADMAKNHLTPENIGKIAAGAGVKRVVLTHFVPSIEEVEDPQVFTQGIAPAYQGPVTVARDLDRF